ncbi:MAG: Uma2 family endonuclease [Chloroflexi bacterium]|nr:Uma2 family endonuclease [Chloroflexota bacterium]
MAEQTMPSVGTALPVDPPATDLVARGYRWRRVPRPDGTETSVQVPLTSGDFLNPQEGDVMPESTFHAATTTDLHDMLRLRYAADPTTAVLHDLIIRWGSPSLPDPAPDIAVVPNVRDRDKSRSAFHVTEEGTKPVLIVEVVSPYYRKEDLVEKVDIYERAGVQEYVILEQREQREQIVETVTGYRLVRDRYRPILLEEDGRMRLQTVGLYIGLQNGKVVLEDVVSGERLRNIEEAEAARVRAEQRAQTEAETRAKAEAELKALREEIERRSLP